MLFRFTIHVRETMRRAVMSALMRSDPSDRVIVDDADVRRALDGLADDRSELTRSLLGA